MCDVVADDLDDDEIKRLIMTRLTVSVPVAGRALAGLSRNGSYVAARADTLGVPVIKAGGRKVVPTTALRKALGLEPPNG